MHLACYCWPLLLVSAGAVNAAHFVPGNAYTYAIRSAAVSRSDFETTVLSAGGSPSAYPAASQGSSSYVFNADIEIAAYNVTADAKTLCKITFLRTPDLVMGGGSGDPANDPDHQHDASGAFDFNAKWFGFALQPSGLVDHVIFDETDHPSVLQIKRGIASLFSAPVNTPSGGPKRRSFEENEPGHYGNELNLYEVDEDVSSGLITYRKRAAVVRRDSEDATHADHFNEKTLVKDSRNGHFVSIAVADQVTLKGSVALKTTGLKRRQSETTADSDSENNTLMTSSGSSNTVFISKSAASHVERPPLDAKTGSIFDPPARHYQPLKSVMPIVRAGIKCFDSSVVNSKSGLTVGQQTSCFSSARQALVALDSSDALLAAEYLLSPLNLGDALWVGYDLVGEMCPATPALLDRLLERAFLSSSDVSQVNHTEATLALQAGFKCVVPSDDALSVLKSVVVHATLPDRNEVIDPALVNHAALLLGHFGSQERERGDTVGAASITDILTTALQRPASKLSRRSTIFPDFREADDNEHFHERSIEDSVAAARRATLIHALRHTKDHEIVATLRSAIFDEEAEIEYHPVVQEAALHALGELSGQAVEDTLLATLTSPDHIPVHGAALRALQARDRNVDMAAVALGAEELMQKHTTVEEAMTPLSARAMRAQDIVELKLNITLAAPSFVWDKKLGADIVGVRLKARAINQVKLFLSLLQTDFSIQIDNVASATLYIDIGSYQELDIFSAQLQLIGEISYNMNVLHDFKLSDVTRMKDIYNGWITDLKTEFTQANITLSSYWALAATTFEELEETIEDVVGTSWSDIFELQSKSWADTAVLATFDVFFELEANIVNFGLSVKDQVLSTINAAKPLMIDAINSVMGGFVNILECPEQSIAAILYAVEEVKDIASLVQASLQQLKTMLSINELENLLPALDEDFTDFVNTTLSGIPELDPIVKLYDEFTGLKDTIEDVIDKAVAAYSIFQLKVREMITLYDKLKSYYDASFGPKADSAFPSVPASIFPAEQWSEYSGMNVQTNVGDRIVAPFAGKYERVDSQTVKITVTESSLKTYQIFLRNIAPGSTTSKVVKKGENVGTAVGSTLGLFIYGGRIDKTSVDPRKYLSRSLPMKKPFEVLANQYGLTVLGDAVVPLQPIIKKSTKGAESSSDVTGKGMIARRSPTDTCHDPRFANPTQVCVNAAIPESPRATQLYKYEQFFMVAGFIPITFSLEFDSVMGIGASVSICLFDLTVAPVLTPHFAIQMVGSAGLGFPGASVGLVARGTVADTHIPIAPQFPLAKMPTGVCLNIDVVIVPLTIELALQVKIILITYTATIAQFSMSPITIHVFDSCPAEGAALKVQEGFLIDTTGPVVTSSDAYQVPNESTASPFIFAKFASHDPESGIDSISVGLGWAPGDMSIVAPRVVPRDQGDSWSIPLSAAAAYDEQTLFVNVVYKNQQNVTTTTSTPVFFDVSPPVVTIWNEQTPLVDYEFVIGKQNARAVLRKNMASFSTALDRSINGTSFSAYSDHLCFYYSVTDGSPQNQTSWAIGSGQQGPEASDIVAWSQDLSAGQGITAVCQTVAVEHAQLYYLNVKTTNVLGYTTSQSSAGTLIDLTPPAAGQMFFGMVPGITTNGTMINSTAFFSFIDFVDPESDVACEWAVENNPYYVNDGLKSYIALAMTGLNMTEGRLQMRKTFAKTPPTGSATLSISENLDLTVHFNYADPGGSSVHTVMVGLGDDYQPHYADYVVLDVGANPQSSFTFAIDPIMQGQIVSGLLIIVDYASNSVHIPSSNALLIDMVPPVPGQVGDGKDLGQDLSWIGSIDTLCASWTEWSSNITGIGAYKVSFGLSPGATDIISWYPVSMDRSACLNVPQESAAFIYDGATIFANVIGFNGIFTTNSTSSSDGVTVDLTPPANFTVFISTPTGSNYIRDVSEVEATWTQSFDAQSGIDNYQVTLVRQRGNVETTLYDYHIADLSNPLMQSAVIRGPSSSVVDYDQVRVCARVTNAAGLYTTNCSVPVIVDGGQPQLLSRAYHGVDRSLTPFYVNDTASIPLLWNWTAVSGIQKYSCTLYDILSAEVLIVPIAANQTGCIISEATQLIDGKIYAATGVVTSYAGSFAQTTFTFMVSTTPPRFTAGATGSISVGSQNIPFTTDGTSVQAWCNFFSPIPIVSYAFAFGSSPNNTDLVDWREVTVPYLSLPMDLAGRNVSKYYAACKAAIASTIYFESLLTFYLTGKSTNEAGQVSPVSPLNSGTEIVAGAKAGSVYDGPLASIETSWQTSNEAVVATFQGFQTSKGMPGVLYSWGLGTTPTTQDVVAFTTAGLLQPTLRRNGTIYWTGTKLKENVVYFVHVQALMASSTGFQKPNATSSGFRVFSRRPTTGFGRPESSVQYVLASPDGTDLSCTATASNAALDHITQRARRWADTISPDLVNSTQSFALTNTRTAISKLSLSAENDGASIACGCQASASTVNMSSLPQQSFLIADSSPPIGVANLACLPAWVALGGNSALCQWDDGIDSESGIVGYTLKVGTTAGGGEIASYSDVLMKNFTLGVPESTPTGTPFLFVTVSVTNSVGLTTSTSTSVQVEWDSLKDGKESIRILSQSGAVTLGNASTPVAVDTGRAVTCQTERDTLRLSWADAFLASASEIDSYEIAVSTSTPSSYADINHVVLDWTAVGRVTEYTLRLRVPLPVNTLVFASVRARTIAGLSYIRSSSKVGIVEGYNVATSGPNALMVSQRLSTQSTPTSFAIQSNFWRASWTFVHVCPIVNYKWSVLDMTDRILATDPATVIYGPQWTSVSNGLALNLNLLPNRTYATQVQAYNELGISSLVAESANTTIIWAPARAGRVYDGPIPGVQTDVFVSLDSLSSTWEPFNTSTCQVQGYQWAVGTDIKDEAHQTAVLPFTDVGLNLAGWSALDVPLTPLTMYYTTVRAVSCTGERLTGFSAGFHVGIRDPPKLGTVRFAYGAITATGIVAQYSRSTVSIVWSGFGSIWSSLIFEVALGSSPDPSKGLVRDFTAVEVPNFSADVEYTFQNLTLDVSSGNQTLYYAHVRATDASFQTAVATSLPFVVDITPPEAQQVILQNQATNDTTWQPQTQNVTFFVNGVQDLESSISDISYKILFHNKTNPRGDSPWVSLSARSFSLIDNSTGAVSVYTDLVPGRHFAADLNAPDQGALVVGNDFSSNQRYSTSSDRFDFLYAEAFNQSEIDCYSDLQRFDGNVSAASLTLSQYSWNLPSSGCAFAAAEGYNLTLSTGNSSCEIRSNIYSAGAKFSATIKASTVANSYTSFLITDALGLIDESPVGTTANTTNTSSAYNAIGFQIRGGLPMTVSIWRVDKYDKARRSEILSVADSSMLLGWLNLSVTIGTRDIAAEVIDPVSGNSLGKQTMGGMGTNYSWLEQLPRMAPRLRIWAPGTILSVPTAQIANVTFPLPNQQPCSFQPTWGSLISGINKVEIGIGSQKGLLDIRGYQTVTPGNQSTSGCLGAQCFLSSPVAVNRNVVLRNITLDGLGLKAFDWINQWCDLSPLEGGCSGSASCINYGYDAASNNNTFDCRCGEGWSGSGFGLHGCAPVQQCAQAAAAGLTLCAQGALCYDAPGTFICTCPAGFKADDPYNKEGLGCVEQDECAIAAAAHQSLCGPGGVCANTVGDYQCVCRPGFRAAGAHSCVDIDECNLITCPSATTCVNLVGGSKCIPQCPSGTSLSSNGTTCLTAPAKCSSAVPLALGITAAGPLSSSQVLLDPQFGNSGRLGQWFQVSNQVGMSIKVSLVNNGPNAMTLQLWGDCLGTPTLLTCATRNTCSMVAATPFIYVLVSATQPSNFTVTAFSPSSVYCGVTCANGGVCVGENLCQCDPNAGWTGPTCEVPRYTMITPRSKTNFTCLDASLGGAVTSRGACAPGPVPGSGTAALSSFQGCYQMPDISPFEPARLSLVVAESRLHFNLTLQACADICRQEQMMLFTFTTLATWRNSRWPALATATSQCLCMPAVPRTAVQIAPTSCSSDGSGGALLNAISGPLFSVTLSSPWCPVSETLTSLTDLSLSYNTPQPCASRTTVSGGTCQFPFFLRGQVYTDCTSDGDVRPWCYTDPLLTVHDYCLGSDIDYCAHPSTVCAANATCVNTASGPACPCKAGFRKINDGTCIDVDECASSPCSVFANCVNAIGSFSCYCNTTAGYFPTADNYTCSYDPDNAGALAGQMPSWRLPSRSKAPRSYIASLKLTNRANLTSVAWTNPIVIDLDAPTYQNISFSYQGNNVDVFRNGSQEVQWQFQSNASGMAYYEYGLGSAPGLTDLVPWARTLSSNITLIVPTPNSSISQVYFMLTGYSGSLLNTTRVIPMSLLTGPPSVNQATVQFTQMGRFLTWQNFTDPVGVSNYYVGIGTQVFGNNLLNWTLTASGNTTVGPFLRDLCSGPGCGTGFLLKQLPSVATPVWFSIRADNRAGFWSPPVAAAFPTVLLGSDAALLDSLTGTGSVRGFEDASAVATITARIPVNSANTAAMIGIGSYQYAITTLTNITLVRPEPLLVLRAGSMYATYALVHLHLLSLMSNGSLSMTLPPSGVNGTITVQALASIGPPCMYYQGQMTSSAYKPGAWTAVSTTSNGAPLISWTPNSPGLYGLYYNSSFPSFTDLNADSLAEILYVQHSTVTERVDYGWGVFGGSISAPSGRRTYVASLSPSYNTTTNFGTAFLMNEVVAAVGDFDADGRLDYVLSTSGFPLYSDWSAAQYQIVFNKSSTARMTIAPPRTMIYPQYYDRYILMGFADIDGDTFLDSVWYSTGLFSINYSPGVTICAGKGGNYATGCTSPWYISFAPFQIVGLGSWSPGASGILTFSRKYNTLSFAIVNFLITKSAAGAVTSISTRSPVAVSLTIQAQPWQVWLARVPGDLNGDGTSDMVLQCTSYIGMCGPSQNLYSYTLVWYLSPVGKVISTAVLSTPLASRIALGTLIYR
ncbi:hypothetical protein HDU88_003443 [Geranomyces variabilis]|nr:hypothetical protein HDU88_003443 [Geranomyces variabilis]